MAIIISIGGMVQAQTIEDRPEYRPSSDIYFDLATGQLLGSAYPIASQADQEFQLNILYQKPFSSDDINQFNDNDGGGVADYNFGDPEQYWLEISENGTSPVEFANLDPDSCTTSILEDVEWTITGKWGACHHTILSGRMVGDKLIVSPRKYRSYDGEGDANDNEPFDGMLLNTEIASYTVSDMGDGVGKLTITIPEDWETASTTGAGYRSVSNILNYTFFLMVPIGAVLLWRGLRRRR